MFNYIPDGERSDALSGFKINSTDSLSLLQVGIGISGGTAEHMQRVDETATIPDPLKAKPLRGTKALITAVVVLTILLLVGIVSALIYFNLSKLVTSL